MDIRTDLAIELHADAVKESKNNNSDGIEVSKEKYPFCELTRIKVIDKSGEEILCKPKGNYITLEFGRVGVSETEKFCSVCDILKTELTNLLYGINGGLPKKILIVGLGNADITADALGPLTIKSVVVTGHLERISSELFESFGGIAITALSTGVMAQTGMESAEIIKSITDRTEPDAVIVIDALASNSMSRLGCTLQLADTGICPGSGIGNNRDALNRETLGVPVISVGVPTMVEIAAIAADAFEKAGANTLSLGRIRDILGEDGKVLVTPKDCGIMIADVAKLIGFAIDKALISDIDYQEIARLVN